MDPLKSDYITHDLPILPSNQGAHIAVQHSNRPRQVPQTLRPELRHLPHCSCGHLMHPGDLQGQALRDGYPQIIHFERWDLPL